MIYNVSLVNISAETSFQAATVAGLWNKNVLQQSDIDIGIYDTIYLNRQPFDGLWLQTALEYYIEITHSSSTITTTQSTVDMIINKAINSSIIKGRILYDATQQYVIPTLVMLCNEFNALPITNESEYNSSKIPIVFNIINKWSNEYESTLFAYSRYLEVTIHPIILNKTMMAVQTPYLLLNGELTDFIISNNLFVLWMSDLCNLTNIENQLYNDIVLNPYYTSTQNMSLSIMGYYAGNEVLASCSPSTKSQISLVSDYVMSLSFHQLLPSITSYLPYKYLIQTSYRKNITYDKTKRYLAIIQSDGDNIQLDINSLRPRMEERMSLCSASNRSNNICPLVSWTISNRLIDLAPHIIYWFYNISNTITNVDSFLMGPSGFGYLHPTVMKQSNLQNIFIENTILNGYLCGKMQGYVHWDDYNNEKNMTQYLMKFDDYNYSSIDNGRINDTNFKFIGIFSPIQPYVAPYIGNQIVTFIESYRWFSSTSPQDVAKTLNKKLNAGSLTYLYKIHDVTFDDVEEMVKLLNTDIILLDYREIIALANNKRKLSI